MIIAAYAATGKTTLAKLYPEKIVDFVCMPYKYQLEPDENCGETCKANPDNIMRDDWPYNYVYAIMEIMNSGRHILIPTDLFVLMSLRMEKIPYLLCYPQRNAKDVYLQRMLNRGNTEAFIDIFIGRWDDFISEFEKDTHGQHVILNPCEFLSDAIKRANLL